MVHIKDESMTNDVNESTLESAMMPSSPQSSLPGDGSTLLPSHSANDSSSSPPPSQDLPAKTFEHCTIKVTNQDGSTLQFKIKPDTPLHKLMDAYCHRFGVKRNVVRFFSDGRRVQDNDTLRGLEISDGANIDVSLHQVGGNGYIYSFNLSM